MSYRFAIIGCGRIAGRHAESISAAGRLVAVCDIVKSRAIALGQQYRALAFQHIADLLNNIEVDVITICTPNGLHAEHASQVLASGRHVLCEKPLAISTEAGRSMIAAATAAGKKLFVVKQNRFNPPVVAVKKLLDNGALGKIYSFQVNCFWNRPRGYYSDSWRGTKLYDGGTLFTQFSHFIDLLYWFLGEVDSISGYRDNYAHGNSIEFEDAGVATLLMNNGAIGTINYTINTNNKNMEGSFTLFGELGSVKIGGQYLNEIEYFSVENQPLPSILAGNGSNQYGFYEGTMSNHPIVYSELVKALADDHYPFVQAAEAIKTVEIIERIYAASPFLYNYPASNEQ